MIHNKFYKMILAIIISNLIFSFMIMPAFVKIIFSDDNINDATTLIIVQILGTIIPNLFILDQFYKHEYYDLFDNFKINFVSKISFIKIIFISLLFFLMTKSFSMLIDNGNLLFFNKLANDTKIYDFKINNFLILLAAYAFIPAIYEEIIYRGLFYKGGANRLHAYILSVIPFIFMHFPLENMLVAILSGTLFFSIRERKNNIIYLILIHFINNMLSLIFSNYIILPFEAANTKQNSLIENGALINIIAISIIFLISLLGFVFFLRLLKKDNIVRKKDSINDSKLISIIVLVLFIIILISNFFN